jgi:hypothetical protein
LKFKKRIGRPGPGWVEEERRADVGEKKEAAK